MGREYRLSRNPRLRKEGDRRHARISPALQVSVRHISLDPRAAIAGIDVGEDFLDIAVLTTEQKRLSFTRLDLRSIGLVESETSPESEAIARMAKRLAAAVPQLHGAIALVD